MNRSFMAPLLALALAGCYRGASSPSGPVSAPSAGPPPHVDLEDNQFHLSRLPAASADGSVVLLAVIGGDGGRGNLNLRFTLLDRNDTQVASHVVLRADEADALLDSEGRVRGLEARLAKANQWLAEQHAARRFIAMQPLQSDPSEDIVPHSASLDHLTISWLDNQLSITQAGRPLHTRTTPTTWLVEDRPTMPGEPMCHNPAYLAGASIDLERKLAALTIDYVGTDTCWEPDAVPHVVSW